MSKSTNFRSRSSVVPGPQGRRLIQARSTSALRRTSGTVIVIVAADTGHVIRSDRTLYDAIRFINRFMRPQFPPPTSGRSVGESRGWNTNPDDTRTHRDGLWG